MQWKLVQAALFLAAALPVCAQVAPSATRGSLPLQVGGGISAYYSDWSGNLLGPTLWVDVSPPRVPRVLQGIGIELEGRDLNYGRTGDESKLRQDTALGGAIYRWNHFHNFRPDAKFLVGFGNQDFNNEANPYYTHDTRTVYAFGGGLEYRIEGNIWIREDYEYQFWTNFFNHHALNPEGFTVGVVYDFRNGRR
jgi:opacity protein-like surface antigen